MPIIQSNPHAGLGVPPEIQGMLQISPRDLYNDADLWADIHFDFSAPGLDPPAGRQRPRRAGQCDHAHRPRSST
ncbi:MAG: hypothetical protein R3A10_07470 [Caldilineaceae bacterium]